MTNQSRAVVRTIEPGNSAICPVCDQQVKFQARTQGKQIICNVYEGGVWQRVEQYHLTCYGEADEPYGSPAP